jgi:hypothetical protein
MQQVQCVLTVEENCFDIVTFVLSERGEIVSSGRKTVWYKDARDAINSYFDLSKILEVVGMYDTYHEPLDDGYSMIIRERMFGDVRMLTDLVSASLRTSVAKKFTTSIRGHFVD